MSSLKITTIVPAHFHQWDVCEINVSPSILAWCECVGDVSWVGDAAATPEKNANLHSWSVISLLLSPSGCLPARPLRDLFSLNVHVLHKKGAQVENAPLPSCACHVITDRNGAQVGRVAFRQSQLKNGGGKSRNKQKSGKQNFTDNNSNTKNVKVNVLVMRWAHTAVSSRSTVTWG